MLSLSLSLIPSASLLLPFVTPFSLQDANEDSTFRDVSIRGDDQAIAAAKAEIQKIIDEVRRSANEADWSGGRV